MSNFELLDPDESNRDKRESILDAKLAHFKDLLSEDFEDVIIICRKKWIDVNVEEDNKLSNQVFFAYTDDLFPLVTLLEAAHKDFKRCTDKTFEE